MSAPLVVIQEAGDANAGARWQPLLEAWPAVALAPDLPGHGSTPPPVGGNYAPADPALHVVRALADAGLRDAPVVLGHRWGGFAAELLAAAGRARAVVLVDGLGGPWIEPDEIGRANARWLRGVLADPAALDPPTTIPDPRLAHGFPSIWERDFTEQRRRVIDVPVLAIETPESPTPAPERADRAAAFGGPAEVVELPSLDVAEVVALVVERFAG